MYDYQFHWNIGFLSYINGDRLYLYFIHSFIFWNIIFKRRSDIVFIIIVTFLYFGFLKIRVIVTVVLFKLVDFTTTQTNVSHQKQELIIYQNIPICLIMNQHFQLLCYENHLVLSQIYLQLLNHLHKSINFYQMHWINRFFHFHLNYFHTYTQYIVIKHTWIHILFNRRRHQLQSQKYPFEVHQHLTKLIIQNIIMYYHVFQFLYFFHKDLS